MQIEPLFKSTSLSQDTPSGPINSRCVLLVQNDSEKRVIPAHSSPYGFILNFEGHVRLKVNHHRYELTNGFIPLNNNSVVELSTRSGERNRNVVLAFDPILFETIVSTESCAHATLLEYPEIQSPSKFNFVCRPYSFSEFMHEGTGIINKFRNQLSITEYELEEWLGLFIRANGLSRLEMEQVPAIRKSTREEIYRRLSAARLFMENHLDRPLQLEEIAAEVQMNRFHFLRLHNQLFRETPHQFLTRKRMEYACLLLKKDASPIAEICGQVGLESPSSFSLLFKRHIGCSPSRFRQNT